MFGCALNHLTSHVHFLQRTMSDGKTEATAIPTETQRRLGVLGALVADSVPKFSYDLVNVVALYGADSFFRLFLD